MSTMAIRLVSELTERGETCPFVSHLLLGWPAPRSLLSLELRLYCAEGL